MIVADILGEKGGEVITVSPEDSALSLARTLAKWRIGAVLVRNADGKIVGIVSERDLIHALATDAAAILHRKVQDLMTGDVVTCRSSDSLQSVMEKMTHGRFRHLPVIDDSELRGIVSIGDVNAWAMDNQRAEIHYLQEYLYGAEGHGSGGYA